MKIHTVSPVERSEGWCRIAPFAPPCPGDHYDVDEQVTYHAMCTCVAFVAARAANIVGLM